MLNHDETFEEEFSNWAKTVLNLQNVRDGSISYIKHKMEPFIDELVQMHGPDEEDHFKELLIKVAVNGEVKKKKPKKNTNGHSWALYDTRCAVCVNVFQRILDNFYRCQCKEWERHDSWKTISPSKYWWIVSKLYVSHNCKIETSLGPEVVEPFAVLSLMHRCKLFQKNLLWFDVGQVIQTRHELVHSINNRLSGDKKDKYLLEMKVLIKKVAVDTSTTDVLKAFEKVENSTIALFTEDGEIHQLAKKALQLQDNCLNADFKSPKGVHATIKSLAMSKIESKSQELKLKYKDQLEKKELERKNAILETQIQQHKIDELVRKLHYETEKNKTYEDNLTEIRSNMENKFEDLQQEIRKQDDEMSSLKREMENKFKDLKQEKRKQDDVISSLKNEMMDESSELKLEKSGRYDNTLSFKSRMMDEISELKQEKSSRDDNTLSSKSRITSPKYEVQSFSDVSVRVDSDEKECYITDMCQMADGTVILIDVENWKLKRLEDTFNVKDFYQLTNIPAYVVPVSSSQVAVLYRDRNIDIILLDDYIMRKEKSVVLKGKPGTAGGMVYCNDQFFIHYRHGLCIYSSSGSMVKRMENLSVSRDSPYINSSNICTNKDKTRVYVIIEDSVYVLNIDGEILSTFQLREYPSYITVTGDDILIMSIGHSGNVDMYDMEGTRLGTLISQTDMLVYPRLMLYDEQKCRLIIGSWYEDNIRVFQLTKKDYRNP